MIALFFLLCTVQHLCYSKKALYLAALLPYESGGVWSAKGSDTACEIALEDVNSTPTLLKDYELRLRKSASGCDRGRAGYQLFEQLKDEDEIVALIAAGCSTATQPIAEITRHLPLIQFSFLSASPELRDRIRYPLYHQINPNENAVNWPRISLMKLFQWNQAVILYEDPFITNVQDLAEKLAAEGFESIAHTVSGNVFSSNSTEVLQKVKDSNIRIIFALVYEPTARKVVCQAYNMKMKSSTYVWIFPGFYHYHEFLWFLEFDKSINCNQQQMKEAINGHFTADITRVSPPDSTSVLPNKTFIQFKQEYSRRVADQFTYYAAYGYDTVVAIALMIDKAANRYPNLFENVTYNNETFVKILNDTLQNEVSFVGFTGKVRFHNLSRQDLEDGYREKTTIQYHRFFEGDPALQSVEVGSNCNASEVNLSCSINWTTADGKTPVSFPHATPAYSNAAIFYVVATIDVLCIILTIFLLLFTFYHRDKRIIKLSSPRLNYLIGIGAVMIYSAVILNGFDGQFFHFDDNSLHLHCCFARDVILTCGFTLAFGSMFAKTWRVSVIFKHGKIASSVKLTDHVLYAIVGVLLLVDILIISLWFGFDPYMQRQNFLETTDRETKFRYKCVSAAGNRWGFILLAYKAIILAIGAFLAFQTRSVYIKSINDSRFIAMSIYNTVVTVILAFAFTFLKDPGISFALTGVSAIIMTSVIIALVFISKAYYLLFQKNEGSFGSKSQASLHDLTNLKRLQKENKQQKLAMQMMITERNLSEATIKRIKKDFELTTEISHDSKVSTSDAVTSSEL